MSAPNSRARRLSVAQAQADVAEFERRERERVIASVEKNTIPEDFPGDRFCEVLSLTHRSATCTCGTLFDAWDMKQRLLIGCNAGQVAFYSTGECHACGTGTSSNYQCVGFARARSRGHDGSGGIECQDVNRGRDAPTSDPTARKR